MKTLKSNLRRVVGLLVCSILILSIVGCKAPDGRIKEMVSLTDENDSAFVIVEEDMYPLIYLIAYHKETKVMYLFSDGKATVLVEPDGSPMLYEESTF